MHVPLRRAVRSNTKTSRSAFSRRLSVEQKTDGHSKTNILARRIALLLILIQSKLEVSLFALLGEKTVCFLPSSVVAAPPHAFAILVTVGYIVIVQLRPPLRFGIGHGEIPTLLASGCVESRPA